jgi:hypothetical protein
MLDARQLEPALTEREMILRDRFVSEYLKDFDAYKACLRLGFQATYAVHWSGQLFDDGYVQRKIAYMTSIPENDPQQEVIDKALVQTTLRRVMQRGSDSARVAAVREFNAMKGWSKPADSGEADEDLVAAFREIASELPS